jgi:MFS family permease
MFLNLDEQITEVATKSIGFTGADLENLNTTINDTAMYAGGTAIDQIELCAGVTPDVVNTTWIVDMYRVVADLAMDFFYIFLVMALITYVLKEKGMLSSSKEAEMVRLVKRSIISSFMIFNGLPILMTLLLINQYISEVFGGASSVTDLMVHSITSPFGCIVVAGGCGAIAWNAIFYLIRLMLIFISCAVWAIAWVLWIWDRTATFAVFMLTIIMVNIFLGSAMTLVYWVGTLFILSPESTGSLVQWGSDVLGLIIMLIAGLLPIFAFIFFVFNPTAMVKKTVYAVAKF